MAAIDRAAIDMPPPRSDASMTTAAKTSSADTVIRMSSTDMVSQAVASWPPAEYQGRNSDTMRSTAPKPAIHSARFTRLGSTAGRLTADGLPSGLHPCGLDGVDQEHRDRHRADSAR